MGSPSVNIEARAATEEHPFAKSQRVFDALTDQLSSRKSLQMTHGDLERLLDKDGREILRQLFQDHLDLRGPGEAEIPVVGARHCGTVASAPTRAQTPLGKYTKIGGASCRHDV